MKTLLKKMTLTLALLVTPMISHAFISINNTLDQGIRFAIYQGDIMIGHSDRMNGHMTYRTEVNPRLEVAAAMKVNNQISQSRPYTIDLDRSTDYNAVVHVTQGKSLFAIEESEATSLGALSLNNTLSQEVLFTIRKTDEDPQKIVIAANSQRVLSLERKYKILIVANGVTLDPILTTNPNINVTVSASKDQNGNDVYTAKY